MWKSVFLLNINMLSCPCLPRAVLSHKHYRLEQNGSNVRSLLEFNKMEELPNSFRLRRSSLCLMLIQIQHLTFQSTDDYLCLFQSVYLNS